MLAETLTTAVSVQTYSGRAPSCTTCGRARADHIRHERLDAEPHQLRDLGVVDFNAPIVAKSHLGGLPLFGLLEAQTFSPFDPALALVLHHEGVNGSDVHRMLKQRQVPQLQLPWHRLHVASLSHVLALVAFHRRSRWRQHWWRGDADGPVWRRKLVHRGRLRSLGLVRLALLLVSLFPHCDWPTRATMGSRWRHKYRSHAIT
mmetsp:Transcript_89844/g.253369  ORF Transcript_89844/g.253369 Transcript_89844/m.253369 type:complete len:203 (+) Transcript_89844:367-975(+)